MKKTLIILSIVLLVCVASVFAFTACNFTFESEGTADFTADSKADCLDLIDSLFEETLNNPNVVVTVKSGSTVYLTENIVGANDHLQYSNGSESFAVKDGDKYLVVVPGENHYAYEDKDSYDSVYCTFLSFVTGAIKNTDDTYGPVMSDQNGTFSGTKHIEEKNGKTNATLTCTYTANEGGRTYTINATEKDGLVQKIDLSATQGEDTQTRTITFAYGSAVVNVPDYQSWGGTDNGDED